MKRVSLTISFSESSIRSDHIMTFQTRWGAIVDLVNDASRHGNCFESSWFNQLKELALTVQLANIILVILSKQSTASGHWQCWFSIRIKNEEYTLRIWWSSSVKNVFYSSRLSLKCTPNDVESHFHLNRIIFGNLRIFGYCCLFEKLSKRRSSDNARELISNP